MEGFLHINDMSWTRKLKNSSDMLSKNETLDLVVSEVSGKDKKINLSLKNTKDDPWLNIDDFYKVDQNINATVLHILEKGIIFITSDEFECILPMSKVKDKTYFNLGESYDLTISEINDSNRRIVLSYEVSNDDSQNIDNDDAESENTDNVDDSSEDNSKE